MDPGRVAGLIEGSVPASVEDVQGLERLVHVLETTNGRYVAEDELSDGLGAAVEDLSMGLASLAAVADVEPVAAAPAVAAPSAPGLRPVPAVGIDLDGDGQPDLALPGLGMSSTPGITWMDEEDRKRQSTRNARALAIMTQFRLGLSEQDKLESFALVVRLELAPLSISRSRCRTRARSGTVSGPPGRLSAGWPGCAGLSVSRPGSSPA